MAVSSSGTGNRVMTSPDGITWTARTSAANNSWTSVIHGNGLFVAVASSGTGNRVMTSSNGITWTARTSTADNNWTSVTYANGLFVAVATSGTGNRVMTSPDGITWTARTSAADNSWNSVTYGNGLFVAVSGTGTGNRVMTSPDGITWTARNAAVENTWRGLTYGNGLFVAVSQSGTGNRVMISGPLSSTWNGSSWSNGTPSAIKTAIIDGNYRTTTNGNISAKNIIINGGDTLFVANAGTITTVKGIINTNLGGLNNNGSISNSLGVFNNNAGATLSGAGSYTGSLVNDGTFSPGNSPGVFTINGNFTNNGTLNIEIAGNGGAGVATGHDKLQINGNAVLGGTVQLSVTNGFSPVDLDTYNFVNVTGILSNTFGTFSAPAGWLVDYAGSNVNTNFSEILPVSLVSFAGKRLNEEQVQLSWKTAQETQNKGFEIEQSFDGKTFEKIGFVVGKGNTTSITNYEFQIMNSKSAYYRLKQVDFDGNFEYSHAIWVEGTSKSVVLGVYPNPSSGLINVSGVENATYSVSNTLGQTVASGEISSETTSLDLSAQTNGMYLLKVISNGTVQTKQVVISR